MTFILKKDILVIHNPWLGTKLSKNVLSNPKMAPILTFSLSQNHIKTTVSELGFLQFPVGLKKNFLCLMLKYQCDNVISCLELWFGHFTSSHTPRFRSTSVLFYLIKWQKCCFRGPIQMLFSVPGACLMATMAQFSSEIHLRT